MPTITDLCGDTPLIYLQNIIEPKRVFYKLEQVNISGSIKQRSAQFLIEQAEQAGHLLPGGTIIESSSGNFGIACAMLGAAKGYKVIILVDPKVTPTNYALLKAYGAEVIIVRQRDESGSYHKTRIALANKLHQEIPNSFRPDQCFNKGNSTAHYLTTAPELLAQCPNLDVLIVTISTGGQIGGMSRYFHEHSPRTKIIAVDAVGSTIFGGNAHSYLLPGMGLSWTPTNLDHLEYLHAIYKVADEDAFLACNLLAKEEGLLVGGSTGAATVVALKMALTDPDERIAVLACDSGERYLDTIFNSTWLREHNLATDCSVKDLKQRALATPLYSDQPLTMANYQSHLAEELKCPTP